MKYFDCNAIISEEIVRFPDTTGRLPGLPSLVFFFFNNPFSRF